MTDEDRATGTGLGRPHESRFPPEPNYEYKGYPPPPNGWAVTRERMEV